MRITLQKVLALMMAAALGLLCAASARAAEPVRPGGLREGPPILEQL